MAHRWAHRLLQKGKKADKGFLVREDGAKVWLGFYLESYDLLFFPKLFFSPIFQLRISVRVVLYINIQVTCIESTNNSKLGILIPNDMGEWWLEADTDSWQVRRCKVEFRGAARGHSVKGFILTAQCGPFSIQYSWKWPRALTNKQANTHEDCVENWENITYFEKIANSF